jgi:type III secretion protein V
MSGAWSLVANGRIQRAAALVRPLLQALAGRGDLALACLVVTVIALLLVPLPTPILDALIATNLAASIAVLMLSVYIESSVGLSTFPALLLLTTLFRLSLNIASTKLILLNGAAGHIIDTFGHLVVGGSVVVGLVVFLIIAIVQFIVIAKGAERVAEVGARFSLDGMPGKQMSIDADLRAGLIDKEEAQSRRSELEEETRLHGALDGAMKFVKGDAIAGILIATINIIAGMAIGISMRRLSLADAVSTYSVLSVGDGMVAQIPSLFVSIAAGILITRVDGRRRGQSHLGSQIAHEVLGHPSALLAAAGIVSIFVLVPGLPAWPFIGLAVLLGGAGYGAHHSANASHANPRRDEAPGRKETPQRPILRVAKRLDVPFAAPLRIRCAPDLQVVLGSALFDVALQREELAISAELGLPFPALTRLADPALLPGHYAIDVQEVEVAMADIDRNNVAKLEPRGKEIAKPREDVLATHLGWVVRRHAEVFIGIEETHQLLTRAATGLPELTGETLKIVPLQRIADVLRRLVEEGVSIRHFREICESLIRWGPREKDIVMLTECVRVDLGRFLTRRYLDPSGNLRAVVLDTAVERTLRDSIQNGPNGGFLALSPEASQALLSAAESALSPLKTDGAQVVLAPMDVRRYLKKFLGSRFPSWAVLSFQELPAHVDVQVTGRLALQPAAQRRSA